MGLEGSPTRGAHRAETRVVRAYRVRWPPSRTAAETPWRAADLRERRVPVRTTAGTSAEPRRRAAAERVASRRSALRASAVRGTRGAALPRPYGPLCRPGGRRSRACAPRLRPEQRVPNPLALPELVPEQTVRRLRPFPKPLDQRRMRLHPAHRIPVDPPRLRQQPGVLPVALVPGMVEDLPQIAGLPRVVA